MKPLICLPMGDPAGIGPEIAVAAAPQVWDVARVVIVGQEEILARAAGLMKVQAPVRLPDGDCTQARSGVINLLHLDVLNPEGFTHGRVQAACGRAAFTCIAKSVELALRGAVDALATPPINKEALKAARVDFIGHTEILAGLTGSNDPLTMFQVQNLRIFFLTRHLALIEACREVTTERVYAHIRRCTEALAGMGLKNPSLAVAGLNPHGGEHGLFGQEETREIEPAVAQAQAEGFNVSGPHPADSVFHFAHKGAWDAVLALYHDQGHIAAKMVDFERTVAVTLGLPFTRTSVDHGTAFDIAGTGQASPVSMIEAIRLAAKYCPGAASAK